MKPIQSIRVLVANDSPLQREGIRSTLEKIPGMNVNSESGTGRELFDLIREQRPHVLVMELETSSDEGLRTIRRVARQFPGLGIVVPSATVSEDFVARALRAGVCGYLLRRSGAEQLGPAIQAAARGNEYLCPLIANRVREDAPGGLQTRKKGSGTELTRRQSQILKFIAEGLSTKEIANATHLSGKTVAFHRGLLMKRLKIHSVPGLVRYAIRAGLIAP